jgi:hypothetical protein
VAAGLPALRDDHLDAVVGCTPCVRHGADLLPHRHPGIAQQRQVARRRVSPVERHDRYPLLGAHLKLPVVVKAGDEVDIERGAADGPLHRMDDRAQRLRLDKAHPDRADPAGLGDGDGQVGRLAGERHPGGGKRVLAPEAVGEPGG